MAQGSMQRVTLILLRSYIHGYVRVVHIMRIYIIVNTSMRQEVIIAILTLAVIVVVALVIAFTISV